MSRSNFLVPNSVVSSAWSMWALMLTSDAAWRIAANIAKPPELVDPASRLGARGLLHHGVRCHLIVMRGHLD